jgi:hypothetical protein
LIGGLQKVRARRTVTPRFTQTLNTTVAEVSEPGGLSVQGNNC